MPPRLCRLVLPRSLHEAMLAQAQAELPRECCGLFAGTIAEDGTGQVGERYPLNNAADDSAVEYFAAPTDLLAAFKDMRNRSLELLAVYHSHPTSRPVPSRKDLQRNGHGDWVIHLIVSLETIPPVTAAWWLREDTYSPAEWKIVESTLQGPPGR